MISRTETGTRSRLGCVEMIGGYMRMSLIGVPRFLVRPPLHILGAGLGGLQGDSRFGFEMRTMLSCSGCGGADEDL